MTGSHGGTQSEDETGNTVEANGGRFAGQARAAPRASQTRDNVICVHRPEVRVRPNVAPDLARSGERSGLKREPDRFELGGRARLVSQAGRREVPAFPVSGPGSVRDRQPADDELDQDPDDPWLLHRHTPPSPRRSAGRPAIYAITAPSTTHDFACMPPGLCGDTTALHPEFRHNFPSPH